MFAQPPRENLGQMGHVLRADVQYGDLVIAQPVVSLQVVREALKRAAMDGTIDLEGQT